MVTDGLTISDSVVLTTFLQADVTSTLWYSIQRFTPTQADSLPSLHRQVRSLSSQQAVKRLKKKDMASIAMSYGYVYVAQISMGADFNQTVKAIAEAEAYPGPSLIIAYAPCINHGIKKGMSKAQTEEELAVKCGYWHNFRFNPAAENKFSLDSKTPDMENYMDFLNGEVRYNSLQRQNPEKAARLFAKNESEAQARYEYLQKLITLYGADKKED